MSLTTEIVLAAAAGTTAAAICAAAAAAAALGGRPHPRRHGQRPLEGAPVAWYRTRTPH